MSKIAQCSRFQKLFLNIFFNVIKRLLNIECFNKKLRNFPKKVQYSKLEIAQFSTKKNSKKGKFYLPVPYGCKKVSININVVFNPTTWCRNIPRYRYNHLSLPIFILCFF